MSTPEAAAIPPVKKRKGRKLLMLGVPVLALVGGGGYAAVATGLVPIGGGADKVDPDQPQLVEEKGSTTAHPRYKYSYHRIEGAFTTNLKDSARFVQVELGVASRYDARVIERVQAHELPIRSAILGVLAQTPEETLSSPGGRVALQRRLRIAVNGVLTAKEGFGGVDDVYFAGLVVQ